MARNAEFEAIPEVGIARLLLELQKLPVSGTVLQVGAHPDDEDNALLAYLVKGLHLNAYYLVANWGEGGQNQIGPELYDALGVLRSQELASARMIDGAGQLCLETYDFGFSKTGAEALAKWGHEACLGRMVRFFRLYRPEIVITHHDTVTGHGQHQAIGALVLEAFDAAADPERFPEQLDREGLHPWQVRKLYVSDKNPTVRVNVGGFNPVLGRSYHELGMLGRSMHKCQGMVAPGLKGDQFRGYKLVKSALAPGHGAEQGLTDGLDFSLGELLEGVGAAPAALRDFRDKLAELKAVIAGVLASFSPFAPAQVAPEVVRGLRLVRQLKSIVVASTLTVAEKDLIQARLRAKERDFVRVVEDLAAASLEVTAEETDVVPGQAVTVTVRFWNRSSLPVEQVRLALTVPSGWALAGEAPMVSALGENQKAEARFAVTVPQGAPFTGAFAGPPVTAVARWQLFGTPLETFGAPELRVVPAVSVELVPEKLMLPMSEEAAAKVVTVKLHNNSKGPLAGQVKLALPAGWTASGDQAFALAGQGFETSVNLQVSVPGGTPEGAYRLGACAEWEGGHCAVGYQVISYPHIDTRYHYKPAEATAAVIDVKVAPGLKVGYVSSGFDNVADCLRQMGVDVWSLSAEDLNAADLHAYDTIVLGIRAYLSRPDLVANNPRLLEYVRSGGNLIVQYNKACEWQSEFAPFPLRVSSRRVTVEEAPVTALQPEHPLFNVPNQLTARDWEGWVQERGLYFPGEWAQEYTPLVAMNDPHEPVERGSWLVAQYGEGTYIYTALAWYRQLDGLVPGGYRAFANMISLPKLR